MARSMLVLRELIMVKLFTVDRDQEAKFLAAMEVLISDDDLLCLSKGGGFSGPNNFDFRRVLDLLRRRRFPVDDYFEFGWAINECGVNYLWGLGSSVRMFASSIYLYSHRSLAFDGNYEPGYYYLLLKTVLEKRDPTHVELLSNFLEWLHDFVVPADEVGSYWLLLTWIVLKVCVDLPAGEQFDAIVRVVYEMKLSKVDIDASHDCVFPRSTDWLVLVDEYAGDSDFCLEKLVPLICGRDF